ncbi:hypothetical protein C8R48DRAFT_676063 [Suillus tomentosus]|nr:hypothetical protein C8R48DRAFT_676063 [Suillus tomentosus]
MSSQFEKAVAYVQGLDKTASGPDATVKLEASHDFVEDRERTILIDTDHPQFYKFYKQGSCASSVEESTVGDADPTKEPSVFSFVERAKWKAWDSIKGMSKTDAEENYVKQLIKYLKEKHPNEPILKELEG